jgi:hypothetical protein
MLLTVSTLAYIGANRSKGSFFRQTAKNNIPMLAQDVELIIKDFDLNEYIDGSCSAHIKAEHFIRRGKRILAFRSNLIKDNIFEKITGRLVSPTSEVAFSSDRAEGNIDASSSLVLSENVVIKINGRQIPANHSARLNFANKTIEVDEKKSFSY